MVINILPLHLLRHGIFSYMLMMFMNDATLPYITLWWYDRFSQIFLMHENICCCVAKDLYDFDESRLRIFLLREKASWIWWGKGDELYGTILCCWRCILGHRFMILHCFLMMFMVFLSDAYGANYIWYNDWWMLYWSYYLTVEVFGLGFKCHIYHLM